MIKIVIRTFSELTSQELYALLALRAEVFVVEQNCIYQDLDYRDQEAEHLLAYDDDQLIAYARILACDKNLSMSFGRLVTVPAYRGKGIGKQLLEVILHHLRTHHSTKAITITAQHYLQSFYENYGFICAGEPFALDGIPHILMVKQP